MTSATSARSYPYFDNAGLPLAIAHRGGWAGEDLGIENSLVAFEAAVDLGYRYLETDVHCTRDGVLVAFHDETLDRTTDGAGRIADLDFQDLARIRIAGREPVVRFEDLLTAWPDVRLNVDTKAEAAIRPLADAIHRHRAWDRVLVASFSERRLRDLRRACGPRVAASYSSASVALLRLTPWTGLVRRMLDPLAQAAQVPVRHSGLDIVTPAFIDRLHTLGKQVHVWTVDDPGEINRLLDLGVDGIIADRIDNLRDVLIARGEWNEASR